MSDVVFLQRLRLKPADLPARCFPVHKRRCPGRYQRTPGTQPNEMNNTTPATCNATKNSTTTKFDLATVDRDAVTGALCTVQCPQDGFYESSPRDFLDEILKFFGGKRCNEGAWLVLGDIRACAVDHFQIGNREPGWSRWQLPSRDGMTRISRIDRDAPWIALSPSGAILWGGKVAAKQRVSLADLLDRAGKHYSTTVGGVA